MPRTPGQRRIAIAEKLPGHVRRQIGGGGQGGNIALVYAPSGAGIADRQRLADLREFEQRMVAAADPLRQQQAEHVSAMQGSQDLRAEFPGALMRLATGIQQRDQAAGITDGISRRDGRTRRRNGPEFCSWHWRPPLGLDNKLPRAGPEASLGRSPDQIGCFGRRARVWAAAAAIAPAAPWRRGYPAAPAPRSQSARCSR